MALTTLDPNTALIVVDLRKRPPGQGLSASTVNVLWGVFNLAVVSARQFGRFNGGDAPERP